MTLDVFKVSGVLCWSLRTTKWNFPWAMMSALNSEEMFRTSAGLSCSISSLVCSIRAKISEVKSTAGSGSLKRLEGLREENARLRLETSQILNKLKSLGSGYSCAFENIGDGDLVTVSEAAGKGIHETRAAAVSDVPALKKKGNVDKQTSKPRPVEGKKGVDTPSSNVEEIHPGRLDFRVGKIIQCDRHPDADTLYVEQIDLGEAAPRIVVSGLVKHVPIEEMMNRMVVVLCNLKHAKMRGVTSEGMVMCASTPDCVEILAPPSGSIPGDVITFAEFPRTPDPVLNPKKKVWETLMPNFRTGSDLIAKFKDVSFEVEGKGPVTTASLAQVQIK